MTEETKQEETNGFNLFEIISEGPYVLGLMENEDRHESDYYTPMIYAVVQKDFGVVEAKGTVFEAMWSFFEGCVDVWKEYEKMAKKSSKSFEVVEGGASKDESKIH